MEITEMKTLLLNQGYAPIHFIPWKKVVKLMVRDKVDVLSKWDFFITFGRGEWAHPSIVRLKYYTPYHIKRRRYNRSGVFKRDKNNCQYCLAPDHKVLTRDLRWVPLGDLQKGDLLIGFEEFGTISSRRHFKKTEILHHEFDVQPVYKVILDDGTIFKATAEHKWLNKKYPNGSYSWDSTLNIIGRHLPKLFDLWSVDESREAGWLAGIFDGEGWVRSRGFSLALAQNPGFVLDFSKKMLNKYDVDFSTNIVSGDCRRVYIKGNYKDKLKLLGTIRPERLIENFEPSNLGDLRSYDNKKVVFIEPAGSQEIVKMTTSTGTFIADGFPHHNCGTQQRVHLLTIDHVMPKSQGGKTSWENCVACCFDCNNKKANRTPKQAMMKKPNPKVPRLTVWHEYQLMQNKHEDWRDYILQG